VRAPATTLSTPAQTLDFLRRKCPKGETAAKLEQARVLQHCSVRSAADALRLQLCSSPQVGLLVSERLINVPGEVRRRPPPPRPRITRPRSSRTR